MANIKLPTVTETLSHNMYTLSEKLLEDLLGGKGSAGAAGGSGSAGSSGSDGTSGSGSAGDGTEDTEPTKPEDLINPELEEFIEKYYAIRRTPEIYTVKLWKFASNQTSAGEKLDANAGLNYTPATNTDKGVDDYENIPLFQWRHVNYVRDKYGMPHPIAIEGMPNYKTTGSVDVGAMQMSFYVKWDESNADYTLLSISAVPFDGAVPWCECVGENDKVLPWCIGSSYFSGIASDGLLRSQPDLEPVANLSLSEFLTEYQKKGKGYWGAGICRNTFAIIFSMVKGATKSSQTLYKGCVDYTYQYDAAKETTGSPIDYFPVTEEQAKTLVVGSYATVGFGSIGTGRYDYGDFTKDRVYANSHAFADNAKIIKIEQVESGIWGVYLSTGPIASTAQVKINDSTFSPTFLSVRTWWKSGSTDQVYRNRDGSAYDNTKGISTLRIQGREYANGLGCVVTDTLLRVERNGGPYGKALYYVADKGAERVRDNSGLLPSYKKVGETPIPTARYADYAGDISIDPVSGASWASAFGASPATGTGDIFVQSNGGLGDAAIVLLTYGWNGLLETAGFSYYNDAAGGTPEKAQSDMCSAD